MRFLNLLKNPARSVDVLMAGVLGLVAALFAYAGLADYAFPGLPAKLLSAWSGLEAMPQAKYPLVSFFVRHVFPENPQAIGPAALFVSTALVFFLTARFLRASMDEDAPEGGKFAVSRAGGLLAAAVFFFTPAVHNAAVYMTPGLFDLAWILLAFALLSSTRASAPATVNVLTVMAAGVMGGFAVGDTVLALLLLPFFLAVAWRGSVRCAGRGYGWTLLFFFSFFVVALIVMPVSHGSIFAYYAAQRQIFRPILKAKDFLLIPLFTLLPFVAMFFSSRKAFSGERSFLQIAYHALLTFFALGAVTPAASAGAHLEAQLYFPVFSSACAAAVCGYLIAFWLDVAFVIHPENESITFGEADPNRAFRLVALPVGGLFLVVLALTFGLNVRDVQDNLDATFEGRDVRPGEFADIIADRIVADLGTRTWFVTDGTLDSHILLAAKRAGKDVNLICLQREGDKAYIQSLAARADRKGLKAHTERLRASGILAFLQEWFRYDPDVAKKVAVFGAPDLWRHALTPEGRPREGVPEVFFFGGEERPGATFDPEVFRAYAKLLSAPENWDSFSLSQEKKLLAFRARNLRRHLGFIACNWACREDAKARKAWNNGEAEDAARHFDAAFDIYDFVIREIDAGNVSALFNELDVIDRLADKNPKAKARRDALVAILDAIRKNEKRRYVMDLLPLAYGYIMNPEQILKFGIGHFKSGQPAKGISDIERASDLLPYGARLQIELGVLAPYYAQERGERSRRRSREIYATYVKKFEAGAEEIVLNSDVLVSLARLAMLNGDFDNAAKALEKAKAVMKDEGTEADIKFLMMKTSYHLMRGELGLARAELDKARDLEPENPGIWAMMAMTVVRQLETIDASADDAAAKQARRVKFEEELNTVILPRMDKLGPSDAAVLKAKSLVKIYRSTHTDTIADRKSLLESARADLVQVLKDNSGDAITGDRVLSLDMELGNVDAALSRAESILRDDSTSALANYVIGSEALSAGNLDKAEEFLSASVASAPDNPLMLNDYAEVLRLKKRYAEAETCARRAIKNAPQLHLALDTLGTIVMESGDTARLPEAEEYIRKACLLSRESEPRLLLSLARVLSRQGKDAEAKEALLKAKRIFDHFPKGHPFLKLYTEAQDEVLKL